MPFTLPPAENVLKKDIKIPLSWLIYLIIIVASLSIGYGGFRVGYQNQSNLMQNLQSDNKALHDDLNNLRYEMGRLKQSVDDLRDSIDRKK